MGVLASVKQLRSVHQIPLSPYFREELQQRKGQRGVSWEGPMGSCLVIPGVWGQQSGKVGLPPGHGEQQDCSPPKVLLTPRVRWGGSGWTDVSGRGEVSRPEMSLESSPGGRGKARRGHSQHHAGDGGLLEATQSWKDWPSGAQLHSLVSL